MKTLLTLFLFPLLTTAQDLPSIPFQKALDRASKEKKILMVQLFSGQCLQCNDIAKKGLGTPEVKTRLEKNEFILTAYDPGTSDHTNLTTKYSLSADFTLVLFFSGQGSLLHKMPGSTTDGPLYVSNMDKAFSNAQVENAMIKSEKAYINGSRDTRLLLQLLAYRQQFGKENRDLLNAYVRFLPADSLNSLTELQTIARFAPELQSYADSALRSNTDRFSEAWYRIGRQERSDINRQIFEKTKARAIANKDRKLIQTTANFAAAVNSDHFHASRNFHFTKIDYALATKDTSGFLAEASVMMNIYMRLNPDSVRKADSLMKQKTIENRRPEAGRTASFNFVSSAQMYAIDINNLAFNVCKMSDNMPLLKKALSWSERSLAFQLTAPSLDTYARLLYKTGDREKAIMYQRKAVEEGKKSYPDPQFEATLQKMTAGVPSLD